jgi:hypothetical protein
MKKSTISKATGAALALAAGTLLNGCQSTGSASSAAGKVELVHCYGVNACGGHNDCKTASNACAGHAGCKGTGFVALPAKACGDVGGATKDSWSGSASQADLVHCFGVNACKGHNDCKTATNACAGHASCKGTGFVATSSKACGDIGGKVKS